jgi:hypothetical protein
LAIFRSCNGQSDWGSFLDVLSLWVIAVVAASGAAWQGVRAGEAWQHLEDERASTRALSQKVQLSRVAFAARAASAVATAPFAADAKHLMALASFDAAGVMRSIESVQMQGAKVSQLDIDTDARRVEIQLDITSADVASTYVQDLNAGDYHPIWVLSRVQSQGSAQSATIRAQVP